MIRPLKPILPLLFLLALIGQSEKSKAQGVSFSYFFPTEGEFAAPVPPISLRGLGVKFGDHFSLSTGISWYRIPGMGVRNVPFDRTNSIMGPMDSFLIPGRGEIIIPMGHTEIRVGGGVFTYFNTRLDVREKRMESALKEHYDRGLLDGNFHHENNWGFGWMAGATYLYFVNNEIGLKLAANYLNGSSDLRLHGNYESTGKGGGPIERDSFEFPDSELRFEGWEFSIGVVMRQE